MTEKTLSVRSKVFFEEMKRFNDHGAEYWSARDLQPPSSRLRGITTLATEFVVENVSEADKIILIV